MLTFIKHHLLLIITMALIVAFFAMAFAAKPAQDAAANRDYTQIDRSSPMLKSSESATVSIIQYSDFLCPYCSIFTTQIMPTIDEKYVRTGKANFEFRPMAYIAEGSMDAGMGGYCAVDQDKFWPYHDGIYAYVADKVLNENKNPQSDTILTPGIIKNIAGQAGLDRQSFDSCLESGEHKQDVIASTQKANRDGITGTPYVLVNGQHYRGSMTLPAFEALVKATIK